MIMVARFVTIDAWFFTASNPFLGVPGASGTVAFRLVTVGARRRVSACRTPLSVAKILRYVSRESCGAGGAGGGVSRVPGAAAVGGPVLDGGGRGLSGSRGGGRVLAAHAAGAGPGGVEHEGVRDLAGAVLRLVLGDGPGVAAVSPGAGAVRALAALSRRGSCRAAGPVPTGAGRAAG